ncbi:MAG: hypothetical protein KF845_15640 [Cyclobacteriaceae bacterium]|nr:hypothetical protein [Cyclobacteriaceae bacterium]
MENNIGLNELLSTFLPASGEDWVNAATPEAGGKNPLEALNWQKSGLSGLPYYDSSNTPEGPFSLAPSANGFLGARAWRNLPKVKVLAEAEANKKALNYLAAGAEGIVFELTNSTVSLDILLANIEWGYCTVGFVCDLVSENFADELIRYINSNASGASTFQGFVLQKTYPHHPQVLHKFIHTLSSHEKIKCLGISSDEKDADEEISDLLAKAVATINQLNVSENPSALQQIFFTTTISTDFFIEIAKLKVLRLLWHNILLAYGVEHAQAQTTVIHAWSNAWVNEAFEPHGNMLKATTAGLAAILGGCSSVTLIPSDETDDRLARIAINVSHVLREESHIGKVADPTAGSFYLEQLIQQLTERSWKKFLQKVNAA